MIRNIIYTFLMFDLILALSILIIWYNTGVNPHTIRLGATLLPIIKQFSLQASMTSFRFSKVDELDPITQVAIQFAIVQNPLIAIINGFIAPINLMIKFVNFLIECVNALIELVNFFYIAITNFQSLTDTLSTL